MAPKRAAHIFMIISPNTSQFIPSRQFTFTCMNDLCATKERVAFVQQMPITQSKLDLLRCAGPGKAAFEGSAGRLFGDSESSLADSVVPERLFGYVKRSPAPIFPPKLVAMIR